MDLQKEREAFDKWHYEQYLLENPNIDIANAKYIYDYAHNNALVYQLRESHFTAWQAAKAQAVPAQLDVNSILHDIDCYFDNGLSNTERTANNLLQSIYEKLSGEVKAQEPAND